MAKVAAGKTPSYKDIRRKRNNKNPSKGKNSKKEPPKFNINKGVYKVVRDFAEEFSITKFAIDIFRSMAYDLLEKLYLDAKVLTAIRKKKRMNIYDAQASMKLNLNVTMARHVMFEASRSIARFLGLINRAPR